MLEIDSIKNDIYLYRSFCYRFLSQKLLVRFPSLSCFMSTNIINVKVCKDGCLFQNTTEILNEIKQLYGLYIRIVHIQYLTIYVKFLYNIAII